MKERLRMTWLNTDTGLPVYVTLYNMNRNDGGQQLVARPAMTWLMKYLGRPVP